MPLSEQEQRLLDEMERSLYHGDADFVASVSRVRGRMRYGVVVGGVVLAVAGLGVVILGVLGHSWPIGAVGFVAMFAGVLLAVGRPGGPRRTGSFPTASGPTGGARGSGGFMDRIAQRWERRRQP